MLYRRDRDLHDKRIAACPAVAFEHLVRFLGDLDNVAVIDAGYAHTDKRRDRQPDLCRIDLSPITGNYLSILELADTLDDGRRRQADTAAKLGVAEAGVRL